MRKLPSVSSTLWNGRRILISVGHDLDHFKSRRAQCARSTSKQKIMVCGTPANFSSKTGCQDDGFHGVARYAVGDSILTKEPLSFVCSNY